MTIPVSIINDTSGADHTGCNAVMDALLALCAEHGLDVVQRLTSRDVIGGHRPIIGALPIINGEGTLHHSNQPARFFPLLLEHLDKYEQPAVLINTVWDCVRFLTPWHWKIMHKWIKFISVRESLSYGHLVKDWRGPTPMITPDLSFWHMTRPEIQAELNQGFARVCTAHSDWLPPDVTPLGIELPLQPARRLDDFISTLMCCKEYHTARFHGACFALMARVPKIEFYPANTHKIRGLMQDVADRGSAARYCDSAPAKIDAMMQGILSI